MEIVKGLFRWPKTVGGVPAGAPIVNLPLSLELPIAPIPKKQKDVYMVPVKMYNPRYDCLFR